MFWNHKLLRRMAQLEHRLDQEREEISALRESVIEAMRRIATLEQTAENQSSLISSLINRLDAHEPSMAMVETLVESFRERMASQKIKEGEIDV